MKKIIITTLSIAIGLLILSSCSEDFLERYPISSQSSGTFYNTAEDFQQATNAAYDGLQQLEHLSQQYFNIWGARCDEEGSSGYEMTPMDNFTDDPLAVAYNGMWTKVFNTIFRCNILLSESEGVSVEDVPNIERYRAEARFLRGFMYFDLVRVWGGMPLYDGSQTLEAYMTIPRSTIEETYDFIIADFRAAAADLSPEYTGSDIGRATSWAAKGFLAKVLLYTKEYSESLSLCNEVIASDKYQFIPNWPDIFNEDNDNGPQAIFQTQYIYGGEGEFTARPGQYFPADAKTFNGRTFTSQGAAGLPLVSELFYESFDATDIRRDWSIGRDYLDMNDAPQTGSFVLKFTIGAADAFDFQKWSANTTRMRYADILMMKVECINEVSGPTSEAVAIIDQIRDRAGLPGLLASEKADKQSFFNSIVRENKHEFAFEDHRWFDLVRWGMAETVVNDYLTTTYPLFSYKMESYNVLFPIPEQQLENIGDESVLGQNPGY
jgi:hypothetical protein